MGRGEVGDPEGVVVLSCPGRRWVGQLVVHRTAECRACWLGDAALGKRRVIRPLPAGEIVGGIGIELHQQSEHLLVWVARPLELDGISTSRNGLLFATPQLPRCGRESKAYFGPGRPTIAAILIVPAPTMLRSAARQGRVAETVVGTCSSNNLSPGTTAAWPMLQLRRPAVQQPRRCRS